MAAAIFCLIGVVGMSYWHLAEVVGLYVFDHFIISIRGCSSSGEDAPDQSCVARHATRDLYIDPAAPVFSDCADGALRVYLAVSVLVSSFVVSLICMLQHLAYLWPCTAHLHKYARSEKG